MLVLPASAFGQATRTWVSGVGDDANPCSRTAPCKTFAGAISKTAAGGEINALDPGGYGGVTITKSIILRARGVTAGVLVSGTNAIVVNAAPTDKVTIRGLDINGIGTGAQTSLSGIKVLSANSVRIIGNDITRFKSGISVVPTSSQTRVVVKRNDIHDNGVGFINAPGNNAISFTAAVLRNNDIESNACGVVTSSFGANASTPDASVGCGTAGIASGINRTAVTSIFGNGISDNGFGVFGRGGSSVTEIARNEITGNFTFGVRHLDSAVMRTFTPASNVITNNAASDAPNQSVPMQ